MKIAVYKDSLATGRGADRAVRNFAAGLAERGHDVSLLEKGEFLSQMAACEKGERDPFDVIVATGSNEIVDLDSMGYFDRARRSKVVLQLHLAPRGFFKWRHPLRNRSIRRAFNKPDAVQVLCHSYADEFRALAPRPSVTVIGNYADRFSPAGRMPGSVNPVILYPAATLNRVKNQKLLIESFALLREEFPDWKVRLLGKDTTPYAKQCQRLIKRRGLSERIEIVGFTDDLAGEYSRASFIAFPSTLEGFPLAILEAAQFSLAAVAQRDLPGVADIVTEATGIVTAPTVADYADGLRRMMADERLRLKLGEGSLRHCEDCYSRAKILDQWEALLENVVK
jgi:glycosyltransferase involved in cell wall biosynthesis